MQKETNIAHGLRWGIIIGVVYCVLLLIRYVNGETNVMMFGFWTFIDYIIVLVLLFLCGVNRRKNLGGTIEFKDAFQTMFIAVLGLEFFYMAFNFLYLKYINPNFFHHLREGMETLMEKNHVDESSINDKLKNLDSLDTNKMNLGSFILSFANSVVISGVFALIFAFIIKRKKDPFNVSAENL